MDEQIQSAAEIDLRYCWETKWGVTPANPVMKSINKVSSSLNGTTEALESQRIRSDRQTDDSGDGLISSSGDLTDELAIGDHDDFMAALLAGSWAAGATITGTVDLGATGTLTRVGGWDGFGPGDIIVLGDTTDDDGEYRIVSITGNVAQLAHRTGEAAEFTAETVAGATIAVDGFRLVNGKVKRSATFETHKTEIAGAQFEVFRGIRFASGSITITPEGIPTIRYSLMGKDWEITALPLDADPDSPGTGELVSAVRGYTMLDGERLELFTNLEISFDNTMSGNAVVGSQYRKQIIYGRLKAMASFGALVDSDRFAVKHKTRQRFNLEVVLQGSRSPKYIRIALPSCKSRSMSTTIQGEGALTVNGELEALRDPTLNAMVVIQKNYA